MDTVVVKPRLVKTSLMCSLSAVGKERHLKPLDQPRGCWRCCWVISVARLIVTPLLAGEDTTHLIAGAARGAESVARRRDAELQDLVHLCQALGQLA